MVAHIGKHFCGEPTWKSWQVTKHNTASERGDDHIARELLLLLYPFTDDNIGMINFLITEYLFIYLFHGYARRGRFEKAMKETKEMLELIQKLPSPRDKPVQELAVRINICVFYSLRRKTRHTLARDGEGYCTVNSVEYQDVEESLRLHFMHCLCSHVVDCNKNGNVTESKRLMGFAKSKVSRCNNAF